MDHVQKFFEDAAASNGVRDLGNQPAFPLPKWVDSEKIKAGQKFVRNHFFSVIFAHFLSLIFLLCYSPVRKVLVKTQKSETTVKALKRYLSTLVHIQRWYEQDLLHSDAEGARDVLEIRSVHSRVSRSFEKRCPLQNMSVQTETCPGGFVQGSPVISQLDMIVTQFGFMGFVTLFPSKFGIFTHDPSELRGFIHLWALIGHLLGIDDRFNLCLEENLPYSRAILEKILIPDLKQGHGDSMELCRALVNGMSMVVPFLSFNSVLTFVKEILSVSNYKFTKEHSHLSPRLSIYDGICFYLMTQCFSHWLQFPIVQAICNYLLRLAIQLSSAKYFVGKSSLQSGGPAKTEEARSRNSRSA